jgi:hypothetical protein
MVQSAAKRRAACGTTTPLNNWPNRSWVGYYANIGTMFSTQASGSRRTDPEVSKLQIDSRLLFIGMAIGFSIAVVGAAVDYWLSRTRHNPRQSQHLPGCMMYVAGALGLAGLLAIIISFILIGSMIPAIILGAGVLTGFYSGFALLLLIYLVATRIRSNTDR